MDWSSVPSIVLRPRLGSVAQLPATPQPPPRRAATSGSFSVAEAVTELPISRQTNSFYLHSTMREKTAQKPATTVQSCLVRVEFSLFKHATELIYDCASAHAAHVHRNSPLSDECLTELSLFANTHVSLSNHFDELGADTIMFT